MADIQHYKGRYILYGANEMPSGLWEVSVTIADDNPEKTAKTLIINNKFDKEKDALDYALTAGKNAIDKIIKGEKSD